MFSKSVWTNLDSDFPVRLTHKVRSEVEIYKRNQESKKTRTRLRKRSRKQEKNQELDQKSDQENKNSTKKVTKKKRKNFLFS